MSDLNTIVLSGRIGHDLENKGTGDMSIVRLRLAVNDWVKKAETTYWLGVTVFGKDADYLLEYGQKGSQVIVKGKLTQREYTKKDGTKGDDIQVIADTVKLVSGKSSAGGGKPAPQRTQGGTSKALPLDNDIPF